MAIEIAFDEIADTWECDLEIFKKQLADYMEWFKSDPNKRLWPLACIWHGKSTFRKWLAHYEYDTRTGVIFRKIKQDGEGKC